MGVIKTTHIYAKVYSLPTIDATVMEGRGVFFYWVLFLYAFAMALPR